MAIFSISTFGSRAHAGSRDVKKIGVSVGFLTEPFPSVVGYDVSYNVLSYLRLTGGYGSVGSLSTFAFDAKAFPIDWNFAPYVTVGFTNVSGSSGGSVGGTNLNVSGNGVYYGAGIDWQMDIGFNLGFNVKVVSIGGLNLSLPGFYTGWYF